MDIKKTFKTDETLENEGAWVDIGEGCELLIARVGNKAYQKMFQKLTQPHRKLIQRNKLDPQILEDLGIQCFARTILLGWRGLKEDGNEVEYSVDAAQRLLTEYKDFRELVAELANEAATFREELDEEDVKN